MKQILTFLLFLFYSSVIAQVGVNTTTPNAALDVNSSSQGVLVSRVALTSKTVAAPVVNPQGGALANGTLVFNTATAGTTPNNVTPGFYYWDATNSKWVAVTSNPSETSWLLTGNTATTAGTNFIGTTDAIDFVARTSNAERMRITASGNIGIGNTTPNAPLQFGNTAQNRKIVLYEGGNNDHNYYGFGINASMLRYQVDGTGSSHGFYASTNATTSNELMRITGTGNVGIGTPTPAYKLDLANGTFGFGANNVRTETRDNAGLQGNAGAQSGFFQTINPTNYPTGATSWWHLIDSRHDGLANNYALQIAGSFFDQDLYFRKTNSSPTTPWSKLLTSNSGWGTTGNAATNASTNFIGTTDAIDFVTRTANTERMRISASGNVGIGTAIPNAPLQFANVTQNRKIVLWDGNNNDHNYYGLGINSFMLRYQVEGTSSSHAFFAGTSTTTSNELMRITGTGNIGIGTPAPAQRLDVQGGNARINNTFIGDVGYGANWAAFSHYSQANVNGYGLLSAGDGTYTLMNKANTGSGYLGFRIGNTDQAVILNNGNMGVGTTNPSKKLTVVNGSIRPAIGNSQDAGISFPIDPGGGNADEAFMRYYVDGGGENTKLLIGINNDDVDDISFYQFGAERMTIYNGFVGIGITTPGALLHVYNAGTGTSCFTDGINYYTSSDARLKTAIAPLSKYGLNTIMQLKPVTYTFNTDKTNKPQVGFVAQDVQKIIPELVSGKEGDIAKGETLGIAYANLVPVLTKAIQEQQVMIEELKKKIEVLEKTITK